jgi:zinc resistance-associated protein
MPKEDFKMRKTKTIITAVVCVAAVALAVNAFAHSGMGWSGGWGHHGPGWHHRGDNGPGNDTQMSEDDYKLFEQNRETFLKETEDLREALFEKEGALQDELAKEVPDATKASTLQKEISELQAQFDQKRIEHMVEMRKANPDAGRGFWRGGPMMGYGSRARGGGNCW